MNKQQVPFISREKELDLIEQLIGESGKPRILCINAPGGIGKTRLLQEVRKRLLAKSANFLHVLEIADFDNPVFQTLESVIKRIIAEQLDKKYFDDYLNCLHDLEKMRGTTVSREGILKKEKEAKESFIQSFNATSAQRRVIWFFDTTDAMREESMKWWQKKFADIGLNRLKNHVLLVAGRDARTIGAEILQPLLPQSVKIIDLLPLEKKASASYLKQKQEQLHIALEEGLEQRLLLLAAGRPIIIDLAVEWRTRGISLSWLTEEPFESLQHLSEEWQKEKSERTKESDTRREEFEKQLVIHLAQTRNEMDLLILLMAHIYPLDREMTADLLKISQDEANLLFDEVKADVFIKSLPDGQIKLHDEMERMVNEYVWPEVDADGDHRREYGRLATEHLQEKIEKNKEKMREIEEHLTIPDNATLTLHLQAVSLKSDILNLKKRKTGYLLSIDLEKGKESFADLFDEAGKSYNWGFRSSIMEQMLKYCGQPENIENYIVTSRYAIHLFDNKEYKEAESFTEKVLCQSELAPEQEIEMLKMLANIKIRLGSYQQGIDNFQKAEKISISKKLDNLLLASLNGLGYNYRLIGWLHEAEKCYIKAYRLSLKLGSGVVGNEQLAELSNNRGYLCALKRDWDSAQRLCREAEKLWQETSVKRGTGIANSTQGVIHIEFDQHEKAIEYFKSAYEIFYAEDDSDYLSMVYLGQATVFWLKKNVSTK